MRSLQAAILLMGFVAFGYEVVLQGVAVTVLGSGSLAMAVVISAFILGYTTGRPLGAWADRLALRQNLRLFSLLQAGGALLMLASLVLVRQAEGIADALANIWPLGMLAEEHRILLAVGAVATLAPMCMGGEIPIALKAATQARPDAAAQVGTLSGRLWSADAVGAALGGMTAALWLVPSLGKGAAMLALAGVALVAAALPWLLLRSAWSLPRGRALLRPAAVALALMVAVGTLGAAAVAESGLRHQVEGRVLHVEQSAYAEIVVTDHPTLGRTLWLDGQLQTSVRDEYQYHEALVQPAAALQGHARHVAILGGGDGGALREVLRDPEVESATVVDLDPAVPRVVRAWMPELPGGAFDDPRAHLVAGDGWRWLRGQPSGSLDLVVVDLPDPTFDAVALLYTAEFYADVRDRLAPDGVLVTQAGSPFEAPTEVASVQATMEHVFGAAALHGSMVWSFGTWAFATASKDGRALATLPADAIAAHYARLDPKPRWYSPEVLPGLLGLARDPSMVGAAGRVSTVDRPVVVSPWYQNGPPGAGAWPAWVSALAVAAGALGLAALAWRSRR